MTGPVPARLISVAVLLLMVSSILPLSSEPNRAAHPRGMYPTERIRLARALLRNPRVALLDYHVSGVEDRATARANLEQTAKGLKAKRSYYGNAPGDAVGLDVRMLRALYLLTQEGYSFRITELAGGSHSSRSRHYVGVAFDIDVLNGREIEPGNRACRRFMERCRELGATEVLGPGSRGHSTHIHVAWPRID